MRTSHFSVAAGRGQPAPRHPIRVPPSFHVREAVFMVFNVDHPLAPQPPLLFFLRRAGLSARHLEKVVPSCPSCLQNHCRKLLELSDNLFPSAVLPLSMSAKRFSWFSLLTFLPCTSRPCCSFVLLSPGGVVRPAPWEELSPVVQVVSKKNGLEWSPLSGGFFPPTAPPPLRAPLSFPFPVSPSGLRTSFRVAVRGCGRSAWCCPSRASCRVRGRSRQSGGLRRRGECQRLPVPPSRRRNASSRLG